mmetsp:Transcript_19556/g.32857  ORF Transcript_19556/g.32857 Transcript_19556/m.32857 type:complete len:145 (+) Transcript_19556:75-509(+)
MKIISPIKVALLVATLAVMVESDDSDDVGNASLKFAGSNECSCQALFTGHCGVFQKETSCWDEPKDYCCARNAGECCDPDAGPIVGVVIGIIAFILLIVFASCACCSCCPCSERICVMCCRRAPRQAGPVIAQGVPVQQGMQMM